MIIRREYLEYVEIYKYFSERWRAGAALTLTEETWSSLDESWRRLSSNLTKWNHRLEDSLPGRLRVIYVWLEQAETLLREPLPQLRQSSDDMGAVVDEYGSLVVALEDALSRLRVCV